MKQEVCAGHNVIARHGPCVLPLSRPLLEAWEKAFETTQEITYQSEALQSYQSPRCQREGDFELKLHICAH